MRRIEQDISSGQFHNMYLLYGPERYLVRQFAKKLQDALCPADDTINVHFYNGKINSVEEIIDLSETMPFFSERRVIFLEDCDLFQTKGDKLAAYLDSPCPTTVFVFVDFQVDAKSKCKLFKALNANGLAVSFARQDEATLERWILSRIKKEGKQISSATLKLFMSKNSNDMQTIETELEKLFCYCMHKDVIEAQDVEAVCALTITDNVFDLVSALGYGNHKRALEIYYELIASKEEPVYILSAISRQFHLLLQTKELLQKGFRDYDIAQKTGLYSNVAKKYIGQSKSFSLPSLRLALAQCVEAETAIKTGRLQPNISVEILILTIGKELP